jgi:choline dehydrogenase-like flavoprotein
MLRAWYTSNSPSESLRIRLHHCWRLSPFSFCVNEGGPAGCVLANRLAAGLPNSKILLIERGQVADNFQARVPLLSLGYNRSDDGVMKYVSAPQQHLNDNRKMNMICGKVLGGTTRINNGLYTRGFPGEFADWGTGWSFHEVGPLYDRSERKVDKPAVSDKVGEWSTRIVNTFFPASKM